MQKVLVIHILIKTPIKICASLRGTHPTFVTCTIP